MLEISIEHQERLVLGLTADGHAEWDESGRDLVCAAASVLLQTLWLGCTEVLHLDVSGGWSSGIFAIRWSPQEALRPDLDVLVQTVILALQRLAHQYPENIRVNDY